MSITNGKKSPFPKNYLIPFPVIPEKLERLDGIEGVTYCTLMVPISSEIHYIGVMPSGDITAFTSCARPPMDLETRENKPYQPHELRTVFLRLVPIGCATDQRWKYRGSVMTPNGPLLIFEEPSDAASMLLVPRESQSRKKER